MTDFPMTAGPLESVGIWLGAGLVDIGGFSLIWLAGAGGAAGDFGGYSSSFRLFHIREDLLDSILCNHDDVLPYVI
jgi:hypothetical protein